jgi:rhodanese-related sulfurtransferase
MSGEIAAAKAKALIHDGGEIAFLDIREAGEFGEGHPLFAIPCPYSRLEARIAALVPRRNVRVLLIDGGDGVAERAARALDSLGYDDVSWIAGGATGWEAAGYTLFKGVNVPSKTLGELAEHAWHPKTIDAQTLAQWRAEGRDFSFFDARPPTEYAKMRVPGAVCLPNGELAHRFPVAVSDPAAPVVVTCAGRTRGIVGVLGLRLAGIETPVYALENGTQGWQLAGFELERSNVAAPFPQLDDAAEQATRARADAFLERHGIPVFGRSQIDAWRAEQARTTYLFDVRSESEAAADPLPAFTSTLSGQLVQASDQWVGVRHARLVLLDDLGLRASIAAFWLRHLGFEVAIARLTDEIRTMEPVDYPVSVPAPHGIGAADALQAVRSSHGCFVDVRSSAAFRAEHIAGAVWGIRPRLRHLPLKPDMPVHLIGDEPEVAALAARELHDLGFADVRAVKGGQSALAACGAAIVSTPDMSRRQDAIDFLHFVHDRHDGNLDASRRYLTWEQGLIAQLDDAERASFRLASPSAG